MTIQQMNDTTAAAVADLEARCFSVPWSREAIRKELSNPWAIWLTAMEGDRLLGYLGVQYGPDGGDIMSVATAPEARRMGVAASLLEEMALQLKGQGLKWLTLEVRLSNAPALALYAHQGFTQVGRRPRYYQNPREDALLLTKFFEEGDTDADTGH